MNREADYCIESVDKQYEDWKTQFNELTKSKFKIAQYHSVALFNSKHKPKVSIEKLFPSESLKRETS